MSIIGNALAGGLADGMREVGNAMAQQYDIDARERELAAKLRAERDNLLLRLQSAAEEGRLDRENRLAVERERNRSRFEERPDLYGADATPTDRAKFTKTETTYSKTTDPEATGEMSDAVSRRAARDKPAEATTKETFDEAGYNKAEGERVQRNIDRRVQVDMPDKYDDQQKGVGRGIVNRLLEKDPGDPKANAAGMAVEGKARFSGTANAVVDGATGEVKTTEVGQSVIDRNRRAPAGRGGGGASGVFKIADINGRSVAIMRDGTQKDLGPSDKFEGKIADTIAKMAKESYEFRQLPPAQQRARVLELMARSGTSQGDNPKPATGAQSAPGPGGKSRPSLDSFFTKR